MVKTIDFKEMALKKTLSINDVRVSLKFNLNEN